MNIFEKINNYIKMPRKKKSEVPVPVDEVPVVPEVPVVDDEVRVMQKFIEEMAMKEALQTYKFLHIFDNELVVIRSKDLDLKVSISEVQSEANLVLEEIVAKGNNSFVKEEIKTVNITKDSNVVVFIKDKDMLNIKYNEFNSDLVESLVSALKNVGTNK